jgi:hypothetical protein
VKVWKWLEGSEVNMVEDRSPTISSRHFELMKVLFDVVGMANHDQALAEDVPSENIKDARPIT